MPPIRAARARFADNSVTEVSIGSGPDWHYIVHMDNARFSVKDMICQPKLAAAVLAAVISAGVTGLAFAGWLDHGDEIFLSYAATGLAWCF